MHCTHRARQRAELSAGLRIKTRGEFESGKVLNDFRRSCLASWFIRKSQFAQRAGRTGARGAEKERKGVGKRRLRRAAARKSPGKLRRCFSPSTSPCYRPIGPRFLQFQPRVIAVPKNISRKRRDGLRRREAGEL